MNPFSFLPSLKRRSDPQGANMHELLAQYDAKAREFIERSTGLPVTKLSDYQSYIAAGTGQVWASARACDLVSNVVSGARFYVVDVKRKEEVEGPGLSELLEMPNPYDSWQDLIYWTALNIKLAGNAYWLRDEMNGKGQPAALYPLLTANMKAIPDAKKKVSAYEYAVSGKTVKYAAEEIIHFRRPKPDDFIFGMGDVEASSSLFEGLINRNALEERFISNGAQPSGILTRKDSAEIFDESQWQGLKARFNAEYSGRRNAGKIAFLNGAWEFVRLALNHQEMQSYEREKSAIEQVFVAHGVPLSVAGLSAASNYATARVEDINFRKYTCVPVLTFISAKLNGMGGVARAFGDQFRVRFDLSGLIDVEQTVRDYKPLVDVGAMTLNELREKAGLQRVADPLLDAYYIDSSRVPLELSGMAGNMPAEPIN